jgi:hypothetical protein
MRNRRLSRRLIVLFGTAWVIAGLAWRVSVHLQQERLNAQLFVAIENRNTNWAIRLLDEGADPNAEKWDTTVKENGWQRIWRLLRGARRNSNSYPVTPILPFREIGISLGYGYGPSLMDPPDPRLIHALLEHGADPNHSSGWGTPLAFYAEYQEHKMVALLLAYGADPNYCPDARSHDPPIARAANDYEPSGIRLLLAHHADPNVRTSEGRTPLMEAARGVWNPAENLELLLKAGADPNARDPEGMTALMMAADDDRPDRVQVLLASRANPMLRAKNGKTALDLARKNGSKDVLKPLEKATRGCLPKNEYLVPK